MAEEEKKSRNRTSANGEGSCRYIESKKLWCARVTVGWKDTPKGRKQVRKAFYGKTKKEALAKATEAQARMLEGKPAVASSIRFSDIAEQWLTVYKAGLQPLTKVGYRTVVDTHIKPAIGNYPLKKLRALDIQKMITNAANSGVCNSTLTKMKIFTNAILEMAIDNGLIYLNPCRKIGIPPTAGIKKEKPVFSPEEEFKIIKFAYEYEKLRTETKRYVTGYAAITLIKAGLRSEELLALRWDNIDFEHDRIHVVQSISLDNGKAYIRERVKSDSSCRTIKMHPEIKKALQTMQRIENRNNLVFCSANGEIWNPRNFQRSYKLFFEWMNTRLDEKEKVGYKSPHCCRHTFASDLNRAGVDAKTIARLMGHSKVDMSLNVYTHVDEKAMDDAISRI